MATIFVDIDGTVADLEHRKHMLTIDRDYDSFYKSCTFDTPIKDMVKIVTDLSGIYRIVFVTGRPECIRQLTRNWLGYVFPKPISESELIMRKDGDKRKDSVVKLELAMSCAVKPLFILEDRDRVVSAWRSGGYRVFQVCDGNY